MINAAWPSKKLECLVDSSRPITYGVVKPGDHDDNHGVAFIRGGDLVQGRISINKLRTITKGVSTKYKRTLLRGGELLISLVGNPGEVAIVPPSLVGANIARQVALVALGSKVNSQYVMYFLMSPLGRAGLVAHMKGSVQIVINLADLRTIEIPIPPLPVQQRIASILSAYDDLIENNTRRIKILEEMAQRIYKQWFIDFKFPSHEKAKFIDSTIGRIPEGWEVKQLGDLLEKTPRKERIPKTEYLESGSIPVIDQGTDFIGGFTSNNEALHNLPLPIVIFGDHTRIIKYINFPFASGADGTQILYPNDKSLLPAYFYYMVNNIDLSNYAYARHFKFLKAEQVLIPKGKVLSDFNQITYGSLIQIQLLRDRNENLRRTRDLLLPKLINGELEL